MVSHKHTIEILHHFQCGVCRKWWSVRDWLVTLALTCPHCGQKGDVDKVETPER